MTPWRFKGADDLNGEKSHRSKVERDYFAGAAGLAPGVGEGDAAGAGAAALPAVAGAGAGAAEAAAWGWAPGLIQQA